MKSIKINGSQRESLGKSSTKALRNAGKVPCVVYGGEKPVHFSADEISFSKLVYTPNAHTVIISMDNKSEINAVIQDIQFHPVTEKILHVDFLQIFEDKEVTITVPVRFEGNAPGVRNQGGNLSKNKRKLKYKKWGSGSVLGRFGLQIRILREKLRRMMGSDLFFINF